MTTDVSPDARPDKVMTLETVLLYKQVLLRFMSATSYSVHDVPYMAHRVVVWWIL